MKRSIRRTLLAGACLAAVLCALSPLCSGRALCAPDSPEKQDKPPLPPGPLIARMSDMSAWEISFSYDTDKSARAKAQTDGAAPATAEAAPSAPLPPPPPPSRDYFPRDRTRRITVTRTKPAWSSVVQDVNGQNFRQWSDGKDLFLEAPNPSEPTLLATVDERKSFVDFGKTDFPDTQWIAAGNYVGVEAIDGSACLVFQKDNMKLWIRQDNRHPVRWQKGGETRSFAILPRPSGPIVFPPQIVKIIEALRKDRKWLAQPMPAGG